ncbi:MAG TPA: SbcC/MukB-like Walker B domain-containing protein [Caulobacteraceae bacterium]|jgi:hypothetical protein|nr:SbcC/MukB-like Walker B domain-containing protein [Caulobacteraceae bacterium]
MMSLCKIALVQWHLFTRSDLDLGGNGAILGPNRSGKSTLIDLIQTVLTGGSANLFRFNRSAGEGGGRSDRDLRSYCLGQLNEHEALRSESVTHIALSFEDPSGARKPVTIGLCIEVPPREGVSIVGRYVAEGVVIGTEAFVEVLADETVRSAPWVVVRDRLERACTESGGRFLRSDTPRNHIREYMRLLFTERRPVEPERFARAFVLALSFEDIRRVEQFVRTYLLEKKDIDIGELRDSIQRYRQIQKDIRELEERLNALQALQAQVSRYDDLLRREEIARGVERLALLLEAGGALFANLSELRTKTAGLLSVDREMADYDAEITRVESQITSLNAQLAVSDIAGQKAMLALEARDAERERTDVLRRLSERFRVAAQGVALLQHRDQLQPYRLGELLQALDAVQTQSAGLQPPDWPRNAKAMDELLDRAARAAASKLSLLLDRRDEAIAHRGEAQREVTRLQQSLKQAKEGRITLEPATLELMALLRREGMHPRAVCEVVDVGQDDWRDAAEILLGRDREAIVVEPDEAARAVELLSRERQRFLGRRIVNTRRLATEESAVRPGSLASTLRSDDPLAMAFIIFRLGNVRLAATQAELLAGGRAIMRDGTYNDGIVVEVRRTRDYKIGRAAAGLMLSELERELADQTAIHKRHSENVAFLDYVRLRLEALATPPSAQDELQVLSSEISTTYDRLTDIHGRQARVASFVDPELQAALDGSTGQLKALQTDRDTLRDVRATLIAEIREARRRLDQGESAPGSWFSLNIRRRRFREQVGSLALFTPVRARYAALRNKAAKQSPGRIAQDMEREANELATDHRACQVEIRGELTRYRLTFNTDAPSGPEMRILADIRPWVDEHVAALEGNELIRYRKQADHAADQISRLFRTDFIHTLNSRFSGLESDLNELNKALRTRPLHGEVYALRSHVRPEFAALHQLARESENDETVLASLFGRGAPRDDRHAAALAQLERLMEDETLRFDDFQDYRNYYSFDLRMRDAATGREASFETRRGTASGAERQVPFYVIIGAALANLYHGVRRPSGSDGQGIGLAVFDEAFSKMDGQNQRTLLDFYADIGLQVIIAAPSEKRAAVLENLDSVIDIHRYGDQVIAETTYIKPHARAAMRTANPHYLTDDDLRMRLGPEAADVAAE